MATKEKRRVCAYIEVDDDDCGTATHLEKIEINVPKNIDEMEVADYISDECGYLVDNWHYMD